jgi:hypothetical protein
MPKYTMNAMALVFFIGVIVLGIVDLGFVVFSGTGSSLSAWFAGHGATPVVSFVLGCVSGHLLFTMVPVSSNGGSKNVQ